MASLGSIRDKLDTKVFNKIGTTAVVQSTSSTIDKWGDATITYGTATTISCVPFDYIVGNVDYQPFGDLRAGESVFVVRYDAAVDVKYKLSFNGVDYEVKRVEEYLYDGGVIAKLIRVSEQL